MILESLLQLALSVARSRLLTELPLSRVSPFTLHLRRRGKPTSTTPDVALEEHVTAAREDTPPSSPPVGGTTLCACGLGGGGVELRRVDPWCTLPRGRGNSRLGSRGHVIRRISVPPGRQLASRDQPTGRAQRLRVLGQLAAGRGGGCTSETSFSVDDRSAFGRAANTALSAIFLPQSSATGIMDVNRAGLKWASFKTVLVSS